MLIRRYEPTDCDAVWNLHSVVMRDTDGPDADVSWAVDLKDIETSFLQPGGDFLVGEMGDEIMAMGGLHKLSVADAEIGRMRVHPEFQRRGLGRAILQALEASACRLGFRRLTLETPVAQVSAQQLYVKNGFQEIGRGELHGMAMVFYAKNI